MNILNGPSVNITRLCTIQLIFNSFLHVFFDRDKILFQAWEMQGLFIKKIMIL